MPYSSIYIHKKKTLIGKSHQQVQVVIQAMDANDQSVLEQRFTDLSKQPCPLTGLYSVSQTMAGLPSTQLLLVE